MYIRWLFLLLMAKSALAVSSPLQDLYFNRQTSNLPEALILYNSANPCETCPTAINMLIKVLEENYRTKLRTYLIDTEKYPEFAAFFKTAASLTLVVVRVQNEETEGYSTLTGLQSQTGAPEDFNRQVTEFINNFLEFY